VNCCDANVINTYKGLIAHWPLFNPMDLVHPMFLTPETRLKSHDSIWFTCNPVGRKTLSNIIRTLAEAVPELKSKRITNKSGKAIGITRMEEARVSREKGICVTSH